MSAIPPNLPTGTPVPVPLPDGQTAAQRPQLPGAEPICTADLAPLRGCLAPRSAYVRVAADARSQELSDDIDGVAWSEWIAGDHRMIPTGEVDGCGCEVMHWRGADNNKSVTLHDGCEKGSGAHIWSGTMLAELDLNGDHLSRLQLAAALHEVTLGEAGAAVGVRLGRGGDDPDLAPLRPEHYERDADEAERRGDHAMAERNRHAAKVMRTHMPAHLTAGEAGLNSRVAGGVPTPPVIAVDGEGGEVGGVPPFPVDALPPVLGGYCDALAASLAVPVELIAPMQLAFLAAGCGPATIYVTDGWEAEPSPLWFMVVSPPSTRKSPVLKQVRVPMDLAVEHINAQLGPRRREALIEAEALEQVAEEAEAKAKDAVKKAAKDVADAQPAPWMVPPVGVPPIGTVNPSPQSFAVAEKLEAARLRTMAEAARAAVPPSVEPTFTDATPEAMMELLERQHGRGFLLHPEASEILTQATRADSKAMETAKFCSAYDHEYISTHRITRGVTEVHKPSLTSLLIVQPERVREAYSPRRNGDRSAVTTNGWSDRQGFCLVPETEPDRLDRDRSIDPTAKAAYDAAVSNEWIRSCMLTAQRPDAQLRFRLTPEAFQVIARSYNLVERIKRQPGVRSEAWGKAVGRAVRIARLFAQLDVAVLDSDAEHPVEAHHMEAGWAISEWMLRSFDAAAGAPETFTEDALVEAAAAYILERLAGGGLTRPRLRSSKRHGPYIGPALDLLESRGQVKVAGQDVRLVA